MFFSLINQPESKMDANLVNPYVEATLHILETTASMTARALKPYRKKNSSPTGEITSMMKMSGDFNGTIAVSFTKECILSIVSKMFGEDMTELDDDIKDAAGEIANMISGQVSTKMTELEKSLKVELDKVLMGSDRVEHLPDRPVIAMPYKTDSGKFTIEVCFEK